MKTLRRDIADVIATKSLRTFNIKKLSQSTAAYLLEENRVNELEPILRDIQTIRAENGYVEVTAFSAHALTDRTRSDITLQVKLLYPKAKHIVITEQLDSRIVGGVRIEFPNQQLDLSIETKLNKFRHLSMTGKGAIS